MDQRRQLAEANIAKLVLQFSIPGIVVTFALALYNVIDRIFIGNSVGANGIAGITVAFPIMLFTGAVTGLVGMGGSTLISLKLGEKKEEEAERVLGNTLMLLVLISLLVTVLGLLFLTPLVRAYGASDAVLPYARDYLSIILLGSIFTFLGAGMNNLIRAEGNPRKAMLTMLVGPAINIILAPLFIFGFGWGIKGSALASVLSQVVSTIWILEHFFSKKSSVKFHTKNLRLSLAISRRILAIGAAPFGIRVMVSVLNLILNDSLVRYGGDTALSSMGVVTSIQLLLSIPLSGIGLGMQPIIGFNYGAKRFDRVKGALAYTLLLSVGIALVVYLFTRLFPEQILSLFGSQDKAMVTFGSHAIIVYLFFLPLVGFQAIASSYFQSTGKARKAMLVTLSKPVLFFIPALLIIPRFLGVEGVLISGPFSDLAAFLFSGIWLLFEWFRLSKVEQQETAVPVPAQQAANDGSSS
jgi:putative MATE family efflux protein